MLAVNGFVANVERLAQVVTRRTPRLTNNYLLMRHPHAWVNQNDILHSEKSKDSPEDTGISTRGITELEASIEKVAEQLDKDKKLLIRTSSLLRCSVAGKYIAQQLTGLGFDVDFESVDGLIDRCWGSLEGQHVNEWGKVLAADLGQNHDLAEDVLRTVESQEGFYSRVIDVLGDCEEEAKDSQVLLITHCDAIQVLSGILTGDIPAHYSHNDQYRNAEIRLVFTA